MHDRSATPAPPAQRPSGTGRFFLRGLGVILPSVLTLWLLATAFRFVDSNIAGPINAGIRLSVAAASMQTGSFAPSEAERADERERSERLGLDASEVAVEWRTTRANVDEWWAARWYLDLAGLALAIAGVYALGRLVGGYLGRKILAAFESGLVSLPGIRQVYPALKQIVEFLFGGDRKAKMSFNRVVMVEYPRPGVWSMGLVTGDAAKEIRAATGDCVTVFMPSSPTPFTGWTVTVPRADVREVDMTIDEALRYLVSAGVVVPTDGAPPAGGAVAGSARPPAA
ncbi:MAG: DUF502 domain-containing protein [Planctomycetota bacterium]